MSPYFQDNGFPDGIDFFSVNTGVLESRPNYPPNLWLERENWPAPLIVDDEANTVSTAFGLSAYPFWVAVDGDGTVVLRLAGTLRSSDFEQLAAVLVNT